jgi:hypothetical protein
MFIKTQSYTPHIPVFLAASFNIFNNPSSGIFLFDDCPVKLNFAYNIGILFLYVSHNIRFVCFFCNKFYDMS